MNIHFTAQVCGLFVDEHVQKIKKHTIIKALSQTLRVISIDLLTEYILGTLEMRQECVRVGVSRRSNCTTTRTNCTCSLSCLRVPTRVSLGAV